METARNAAAKRVGDAGALVVCQRNGKLHGEKTEQRGEFDDRVQGDRGSVFERIADGVADDGGRVKVRPFLLQLGLDDLLGVVPRPAGVGHEDCLIETEQRDRNQIADEEIRLEERERQSGEEHRQEDVEHPLLGVLRADLHDLLAVGDRGLSRAFELDVGLDEFHSAVGAGCDGLHGSAGEPIDDRAAGDQAEQERRMENRQVRKQIRPSGRE